MFVIRTVAIAAVWVAVTPPGLHAQPPQPLAPAGAASRSVTAASCEVRRTTKIDLVGSDDVNMRLSHQRAEAVGRFLVEQGGGAARIAMQSQGASNPIADNDTAEGRQQNRRVELIVSGDAIGTSIGNQR